jgi:hypothetical protein
VYEMYPFLHTQQTRSGFFFASPTSKPAPASLTTSRTTSSIPDSSMKNWLTPLYVTALCSASCVPRKRESETSFGKSFPKNRYPGANKRGRTRQITPILQA